MECTTDNAFSLRDLVLPELVKIIVVCCIKNLRLNSNVVLYTINIKNRSSKIDGVVMGGRDMVVGIPSY